MNNRTFGQVKHSTQKLGKGVKIACKPIQRKKTQKIKTLRQVKKVKAKKTLGFLGHWSLWGIIILFAGGALAWAGRKYIQADSALVLQDIECQGHKQLSTEVLLSGLPVEFGQKLWSIPKDSIIKTLNANPWVREASIELKWPGKMVIQVQEQEPLAVMPGPHSGQSWIGLAADGRWLPRVEMGGGDWPIMDFSKKWNPSLRKALGKFLLVAKMKAPEIYQTLSQVTPLENGTVALYTLDGQKVFHISLTEDVVVTLKQWREFSRYTSKSTLSKCIIDLRVPGYAYIRAQAEGV